MMYTQFLCAALLLSNSFFSLQGMAQTITLSETSENNLNYPSPEYGCGTSIYYDESRNTSCGFSHTNPIQNVEATTDVIVDVKVDVIAKVIAKTRYASYSEYTINDNYESPGSYFDRLEKHNLIQRGILEDKTRKIKAQLFILAYDPIMSVAQKAKLLALTEKDNLYELQKGLREAKWRNTFVFEMDDVISEAIYDLYPGYIPTSILVQKYPDSGNNYGYSSSSPMQTVAIQDCDIKVLDQLSNTNKSILSWFYTKKPISIFFVPEKPKTINTQPTYVQCVQTSGTEFNSGGGLNLAGATIQNCHEIEYPQNIDGLHDMQNMHYMSAADGGAYVILGGMGSLSTVVPVLVPVVATGSAGYIIYKIIKEKAEKKAAKKAEEAKEQAAKKAQEEKTKEERKAQEAKLKAEKEAQKAKNKNGGGGGPEKPDDDNKDAKEKAAGIVALAEALSDSNKDKKVIIPNKPDVEKHIFRSEPGHLPDTLENRKLIIDVGSDKKTFLL